MRKWLGSREAKKIISIICIVIVVVVVQILGVTYLNRKLYDVSLEQSMRQVEEMSLYIENSLYLGLERHVHALDIIRAQVELSGELLSDEMVEKLKEFHDISDFELMGIADLKGRGVDSEGHDHTIVYSYIQEQIREDKIFVSNGQLNRNETLIFIAIPLKINGQISGMLWGKYELEDIIKNIQFVDDAYRYFQIIDDQGKYILTSDSEFILNPDQKTFYATIWDELRDYQYKDGLTAEDIYSSIQRGESGKFYFEGKGQGRYVSYRPLHINNWYLFSVLVEEELHNYVNSVQEVATRFFSVLTISLVAIFGIIYNMTYNMYKKIEKQNRDIQTLNGMFWVTLQQSKIIPFTVDYGLKQIVLYGYPTKDTIQRTSFHSVSPDQMLQNGLLDEGSLEVYKKLYQTLMIEKKKCDPVIICSRLWEKREWLRISITSDNVEDGERMVGVLESYKEHMEKDLKIKQHSDDIKKIEKKSQTDFLTNLYNREAFIKRMQEALEELGRAQRIGALLVLDLDHFKEVNDSMGHGTGDMVLQETANTLRAFFGDGDLVGRLGGDEFVIFVRDAEELPVLERRMEALNRLLCRTYHKDGTSVQVSASIGAARTCGDHLTFHVLYEKADFALYQVKKGSRNGYHIYEESKVIKSAAATGPVGE